MHTYREEGIQRQGREVTQGNGGEETLGAESVHAGEGKEELLVLIQRREEVCVCMCVCVWVCGCLCE